jgi:hypothetical protein
VATLAELRSSSSSVRRCRPAFGSNIERGARDEDLFIDLSRAETNVRSSHHICQGVYCGFCTMPTEFLRCGYRSEEGCWNWMYFSGGHGSCLPLSFNMPAFAASMFERHGTLRPSPSLSTQNELACSEWARHTRSRSNGSNSPSSARAKVP